VVSKDKTLDRIHIRDLDLRCIVGLNDWEREKKQDVTINLTLHADLGAAGTSDDIGDTVDYKRLKDRIVALVEGSDFRLIERLAEAIAEIALEDPRAARVDVAVDKPGALRFARSVAVEISRTR
jgi:FolB domain-containing protein